MNNLKFNFLFFFNVSVRGKMDNTAVRDVMFRTTKI